MCTNKPIIPATGEEALSQSDYAGEGPQALRLVRSFRSRWSVTGGHRLAATAGSANPGLGLAWAHNHNATLVVSANTSATLLQGTGSTLSFTWTAGAWRPSDNGTSTLVANTLPSTGQTGYLLTRSDDDSRWQFDGSGRLLSMTERNGWTTSYTYSGNQLSSVTNAFGRSIRFAYNAAGQLSTATLPDGQTISYTFDSAQRLSAVRYPDNTSKTYLYEDTRWPHSVTGIVDENGNRLASVVYDAQGRAVESGYAGGADYYKVAYPATSNWSSAQITDPLGTVRTYSYGTALGKLSVTGADKPSGSGGADAASRVQNASGLIDLETDFLGVQTTFSWDTIRRLPTATTRAAGRAEAQTTTTQWHPVWRLPTLVTEGTRSTAFGYDTLGRLTSQTATDTTTGQQRSWAWTYNSQGLVATSTDPLGASTSFSYDSAGNLIALKDPLGQQSTFTYDTAGRVLTQTAPNGLLTSYAYDLRGRLVQTTAGSGAAAEVQTYSYTPSGQLAGTTLASGYAITYRYDTAQRLIGASDNRGNSVAYTLDGMGNRLREEVKDANGNIALLTQRTINTLNRVAALTSAQGHSTQFGFDANGRTVSRTNAQSHTTSHSLDALGRPVGTTLPDNSQTRLAWNALDQLTSATDAKGITTQYSRNAWDEVLSETSPDSGTTHHERDAAGRISASTNARGHTTRYVRDALGRPTRITLADGTTHSLEWDSTGQLAQFSDPSGNTHYQRDTLGRILQKTQTVADNPFAPGTYSVGYQYHSGGSVSQLRYPSGLTLYYRKNASGQITQVDVQEPGKNQPILPWLTELRYTALGQPSAWRWNCLRGAGRTATALPCDSAQRSFDADGRMVSTEFSRYGYDSASRITQLGQTLHSSAGAVSMNWTVAYDSRDRITQFSRAGASSAYSYDANSNRLGSVSTTVGDTDLDGDFDQGDWNQSSVQSLNVDPTSNRLLGLELVQTTTSTNAKGKVKTTSTSSAWSYVLDAVGNLLGDGVRQFDYDANNRLSQVSIGQGQEASKVTYLHNALGLRVFKSEPQVAQLAPDEETLGAGFVAWLKRFFGWLFGAAQENATLGQSYVYDDAVLGETPSLLGEYGNGGSRSSGRLEYLWLPTESGQAIPVGLYRNGRFYAVHSDHLGTPRLITDDAATPVWQWAYSAFGENSPSGILKATTNPKQALTNQPMLLKASKPAITVNLRFPGQYADEESGLFYNHFRSYRPGVGSYTQTDPIGLEGGWNRMGYVSANPLRYIDPTGEIAVADDVVIGSGVLAVGCAMSPGCRDAIGGAITSAGNAVSSSIDQVGSIADQIMQMAKGGKSQGRNWATEHAKSEAQMSGKDPCEILDEMLATAKASGNTKKAGDIIEAQKFMDCRNQNKRRNKYRCGG